jgi:predicted Zn-dependent peptidase
MSVTISHLPNGLTIVTDPMAAVETASLGVWVDTGARHETPALNGVSHMLEHMAFKGTERRSARAIAEEIEAVGGHLNAYTSRENTAYYAKVLKEDVGLAMDILSDILQRSIFDPEELERERAVILQEISQTLDTPDDIVFDYFQSTAYPTQGLGRPVLGTAESVKALDRASVVGYMRSNYGAERMVLSAAGKIEHERIVDYANDMFADFPRASIPPPELATYKGGDFREERDLEQVHLVLGFNGVTYDDRDFYPISVFSTLFGGGMSSRLFQEIREKRGLAYSVYSFSSSYHDGGIFGIYAGTSEGECAELIPVLCDEIAKVMEKVDEVEVRRAKAQIKASVLMSLESTSSRCEQMARQMLVFGRPIPTEETVAKIEAVDVEAVLACAKRIFASPLTVTALGPVKNIESFEEIAGRLGIKGAV